MNDFYIQIANWRKCALHILMFALLLRNFTEEQHIDKIRDRTRDMCIRSSDPTISNNYAKEKRNRVTKNPGLHLIQ